MKTKPEKYRPFSGGYVSDFEQYLNGFLAEHPEVQEDRQHGWYIWWDHRLDLAEMDQQDKNEVPVKTYRDE
jgi:hypothetical protein